MPPGPSDALTAVAALGRRSGLPVDDLRVLSARGNLVVHLAPAPVLARAATLTGRTRRDPAAWLRREVAVARYAADRGGPVAPPTALVDPGPHDVDGTPVSLFEFRAVTPGRPTGAELGAALGALHRAAAGCPADLPWLAPATDQVDEALALCERNRWWPPDVLRALRARHVRVLADLDGAGSAPVVLHGDAHRGNLLRGADGWFWVDLEETCAGPPEWDLAVLGQALTGEEHGAALAAYAGATGTAVPTGTQLGPFLAAREVEAVAWFAAMAHLHPERYRAGAEACVAALLAP